MNDILVMLPSRGRPVKIVDSVHAWLHASSNKSDLLLCLDEDDPTLQAYKALQLEGMGAKFRIGERLKVWPTINKVVGENPDYKYYAFIGDDHILRTKGWEDLVINKIENEGKGWGVVYGDDLFQREKLATAVIISANIVKTLGYFALPGLIHLYPDNFWMDIGRGINRLFYMPEIIIEHMHFEAGKSPKDAQYAEVNSPEMYSHDGQIYSEWLKSGKEQDIQKLLKAMQ